MCRASISLSSKASFGVCSAVQAKRERKLLSKLFKDIARRCLLPTPGINLLHFLKCTTLPGLFGEQFFRALDQDEDGQLSRAEFVEGLMSLHRGTYSEVAKIVFEVVDFNHKGFIIPEEVRVLCHYLRSACLRCGAKVQKSWNLEDRLKAVFGPHAVLSFEDVMEGIEGQWDFFDEVLQALLTSLPPVIEDTFMLVHSCPSQSCAETSDGVLRSLRFQGRRLFFELRHQALYCFNSIDKSHMKSLILLKGLFVEPLEATEFTLRTQRFSYSFEAESEAERDDWVSRIVEATGYRWFDDYYETGELLGEGAYGQVLKAKDRSSRAAAAVKIISKDNLDAKAELRIRREIEVLKLGTHENLLELYDVFETSARIYIVTELVAGGTLFSWLQQQNFCVSEEAARCIMTDVARAVHFLHIRGVVHRDIKLENVLLSLDGKLPHAKLIDFGLAVFLGPGQFSDEPVGTLKYVCPEIISRLQYNEKADSWSLGVLLYILLHGTTPFFGKTDEEVALRILKKKLHFASGKWEEVSLGARLLLEKLLTRRAAARLSVRELVQSSWMTSE